jgi:transposase
VTQLRHALSDAHYAIIEPLLPTNDRPGRPWKRHRSVINGILWVLHTGAPWRDLPRPTYGPWQTVYERFNRWVKDGTWGRLLEALHVRLDAAGKIDWDLFCVDGSSIRASRDAAGASSTDGTPSEPADHALGRSRCGNGSKIHLVCDGTGLPMAVTVTAGQRHESTQFEAVMGQVRVPRPKGRPRRRPRRLAGDKGYSYPRIRRYLRRRRIKAVIPTRKDQVRLPSFEKATYRRRNVVERCIGWLKDRRRLATRFEKLAENFLAMVKLAMLERLLKALLPDTALGSYR